MDTNYSQRYQSYIKALLIILAMNCMLTGCSLQKDNNADKLADSTKEQEAIVVEQIPVVDNAFKTPMLEDIQSKEPDEEEAMEEAFYILEIDDELFSKMYRKSFKEDCTLLRQDLRYLHILHVNLEGDTLEGELVCNAYIAEDVLEIFKELYEAGYPIERVRLIDEYDADDESSMRDNNSSCFNFRFISNTKKVSKHGLGMAIDINPLYNPYVYNNEGELTVEPKTAVEYIDRDADFPYKITEEDLAYKLFTERGFIWGGNFSTRKDYQHFEAPDDWIEH